jgi:hypothetical protein
LQPASFTSCQEGQASLRHAAGQRQCKVTEQCMLGWLLRPRSARNQNSCSRWLQGTRCTVSAAGCTCRDCSRRPGTLQLWMTG